MSGRKRKQRGLIILTAALIISLIAGSAGFATGYLADAKKRTALSAELSLLKESVSDENIKNAEKLQQENEELSLKVTELEDQVASLTEENEKLKVLKTEAAETDVTESTLSDSVLDPVGSADKSEISDYEDEAETDRVGLVDKITKYAILIIVAILVLMGIGMFIFGRKDGYEEDDELSEDEPLEDKKIDDIKISGEVPDDTVRHDRINLFEEEEAASKTDGEDTEKPNLSGEEFSLKEEVPVSDKEKRQEESANQENADEPAYVPETLEELMTRRHGGEDE